MFGIQKLLSLSFAFSLGLISLLFLSLLLQKPFSHFHSWRTHRGLKSRCVRHAAAAPVMGKFSEATLKWFFCLLRAWRSWALFHTAHRKSQRQMWKSFHRLTLHLHSTLNGAARNHLLSPCTVVTWPFKPCGKFGTLELFALTFTVLLTTENGSVCVKTWRSVCELLTCKCCKAEMWIYSIYGTFNETWL